MLSMCVDCIYVTPFSAVAERALLLFSLRQLTRSAARSCRRPGPCTMLGPTPPQRVGVGPDFQEIDSTKVSAAGDVCPAGSNSASDGRILVGPAGEASGRDSDAGKDHAIRPRRPRGGPPGSSLAPLPGCQAARGRSVFDKDWTRTGLVYDGTRLELSRAPPPRTGTRPGARRCRPRRHARLASRQVLKVAQKKVGGKNLARKKREGERDKSKKRVRRERKHACKREGKGKKSESDPDGRGCAPDVSRVFMSWRRRHHPRN